MRIVLLLLLTAALAGCFGSDQLSEDEARDATRSALISLAEDMSDPDGGDLKAIQGDLQMDSAELGLESATVIVTMEWGTGGDLLLDLFIQTESGELRGGAQMAVLCTADAIYTTVEDTTLEARRSDSCIDEELTEDSIPAEDADIESVDPKSDGSVVAVIQGDEDRHTVTVSPQGRITKIQSEGENFSGEMVFQYGAREAIERPDVDARVPSDNAGLGGFNNGAYRWQASFNPEAVPNGEIEVRVMDGESIVATFTPGTDAESAGFTFDYTDDGDGMFGEGDQFTISSGSWTSSGQYSVVLYDTWADRNVGDIPVPGLGALVFVALAAVALLRRR